MCHVATTHVVAAPHGFACVGIPATRLYIPSFIEIRSGVSEPQGVKIWPFPLLWLVAFTTACSRDYYYYYYYESMNISPFQTSSLVVVRPPCGQFQRNLDAYKIISKQVSKSLRRQLTTLWSRFFKSSFLVFENLLTDREWRCRSHAFYPVLAADQASETRIANALGTQDESIKTHPENAHVDLFTDHFSGPVKQSVKCVCVSNKCVSLCVRVITCELDDLWPR